MYIPPAILTFILGIINDKLKPLPEYVNISLVQHEGDSSNNHFRIINNAPFAIALAETSVCGTGDDKGVLLPSLYHISTSVDPLSGKAVHNQIPFHSDGIFLYPGGIYYFPLVGIKLSTDLKTSIKHGDLKAIFRFRTQEGRLSKPFKKDIVIVKAFIDAKSVIAQF